MRKQGSILIEVMASIMILSLTTTFIVSACIDNSKVLKQRILKEEADRTVCNIINEFKYNISKEDITKLLTDKKIGFKYDNNLSKELLETGVKDIEKGNDIELTQVGEDEMGLKFKVVAKINNGESEISFEKEFTKSWWMDEV